MTYLIRIWLSHHQASLELSQPNMVGLAPQPELNQQTWLGPETELTKAEAGRSHSLLGLGLASYTGAPSAHSLTGHFQRQCLALSTHI